MIFHENCLLAYHIIPYFCRKLGKMSQNLLSAAVMIGALWVKVKQQPLSCSAGGGGGGLNIFYWPNLHIQIFLSNILSKYFIQNIVNREFSNPAK